MKHIIRAVLAIWPLFAFISDASAWQTTISGSGAGINSLDLASAVALDTAGNVVAAGQIASSGTNLDFTVIKFDAMSGRERWRRTISGTAGSGTVNAVTTDANGDIIAAGWTDYTGTRSDLTVVKFSGATGSELWRQVIDGGGSSASINWASAIALDSAGDVIVGGTINYRRGGGSYFSTSSILVAKFSGSNGQELWRQVVKSEWNNEPRSITVDAIGDVFVAGVLDNIKGSSNFIVMKFDGVSGTELWRQIIMGTRSGGFNEARAIGVDPKGNVVAAGVITDDAGSNFIVIKFNGIGGQELWRQAIKSNGEANAVSIDAYGDVLAAGTTYNTGSDADFTVVKLNGNTGESFWLTAISSNGAFSDTANAVTVDASGNAIAAGRFNNAGSADFAVIELDGANGAELWRQLIHGTDNNGIDESFAVAVDRHGNPVAAGVTYNTGTGGDFTVVKLRGTDGGDFVGPASLAVAPRVIRAGGTVTATWSGIAKPTAKDWIGIYSPGCPNRKPIDWIYVSCSKTPGSSSAEGSCPMVVPAHLKPGEYVLRLFANDGFIRLATSHGFRVMRSAHDKKGHEGK